MTLGSGPTSRRPRSGAAAAWRAWSGMWRDRDRRRAALLSGVVHLVLLLVVIVAVRLPEAEPPPTYLVIDLGTPIEAPDVVEAPAADAPAPSAPTPRVADAVVGEPRAATTPAAEPASPASAAETRQPEAAASAADATAVAAPDVPTPVPAAVVPPVAAPEVPLAAAPATPLPAIDEPELTPAPLAERVPVPLPEVTALVPQAQMIAPAPQVTVAAASPVPTPAVRADVAAVAAVPVPAPSADVVAAAPVPLPDATAAVTAARPVATPDVAASVAAARDVRTQPDVAVATPRPTPVPSVRAEVRAPAVPEAPQVDPSAAADDTTVASTRPDGRVAGGDAANPAQSGPLDPSAAAAAAGAAAGPDGGPEPSGSPAVPRPPFTRQLDRPIAVLVDNVGGYPQSGLAPASLVVELPVEGGLTRLMLVFDREDPQRVGPVRSAREYFVELAEVLDAVLVHDGGSPGALAAIGSAPTPTLNAFSRGDLFSRGDGQAPYNLFSLGDALRAAVQRIDPTRGRTVVTTIYQPPEEAPPVSAVTVRYGATYATGFRYERALDAYRWVRDGTPAVDAAGEAVLVDAVLVGAIEARPFPGDPAGRLSVPLVGGEATLYVGGRAVAGRWTLAEGIGVRFVVADEVVDLTPLRTWVVLTPTYAGRQVVAD